ncbi:MAG: hypothetical protein HOD52_06210 [Candidatus Marinimicrobia bacterium]|jgi:hypothetical protein|nr:hypothetical protein [Candidatus Neomarinimicrobiota bacterium]
MKNILARGGIEFIAVLLGISGSLWIDQNQELRQKNEYEVTLLNSIYSDINQTEKFLESRDRAFQADSIWMNYFAINWDNMNVDSVAIALSKQKPFVFNTLFFDYREFHPPLSSIEMIMQDGSLKEIQNIEIRKKINNLYKTDLGFVLKNVQSEIDMQINFRNTLVNQNDKELAQVLSTTHKEIRDRNNDNVDNYDKPIEEIKYFLTKDYVRTYLDLKNRNRFFVMFFIKNFKVTLKELKILIEKELKIS